YLYLIQLSLCSVLSSSLLFCFVLKEALFWCCGLNSAFPFVARLNIPRTPSQGPADTQADRFVEGARLPGSVQSERWETIERRRVRSQGSQWYRSRPRCTGLESSHVQV